jgi:hypothetical protein
VPAEADVIATLFGRRRRATTLDDRNIGSRVLMELRQLRQPHRAGHRRASRSASALLERRIELIPVERGASDLIGLGIGLMPLPPATFMMRVIIYRPRKPDISLDWMDGDTDEMPDSRGVCRPQPGNNHPRSKCSRLP